MKLAHSSSLTECWNRNLVWKDHCGTTPTCSRSIQHLQTDSFGEPADLPLQEYVRGMYLASARHCANLEAFKRSSMLTVPILHQINLNYREYEEYRKNRPLDSTLRDTEKDCAKLLPLTGFMEFVGDIELTKLKIHLNIENFHLATPTELWVLKAVLKSIAVMKKMHFYGECLTTFTFTSTRWARHRDIFHECPFTVDCWDLQADRFCWLATL